MKRFRILVMETKYVAHYVDGEDATDAKNRWLEMNAESDDREIEDIQLEIQLIEEMTE